MMYANGEAVNVDYQQSVYWFRKSADQRFAPAQLRLGELHYFGMGGLPADHGPIGLYVVKIVEVYAADRIVSKVFDDRNLRKVGHLIVFIPELQGDKGLESPRFVLQLAEGEEVVGPLLGGLDVAVEHGAVRLDKPLWRK